MLALVLVGALLAQQTLAAPSGCVEFCDDAPSGYNAGGHRSSQSSYKASSSYKAYSSGGRGNGLDYKGSRLEDFGSSSTGIGIDLNRPGSWRDQKHYITDDGRGEMNYEAGQTVSDNSFSKFAKHSYSYGTHDKHAKRVDSEVISSGDFQQQLQNIRNSIDSFMNSFHVQAGMTITDNFIQDFKNKANLITNQLNNVCQRVDSGSTMYQQMQHELQEFQRQSAQRLHQFEAMFQASSTISSSQSYQPGVPTNQPSAPIQQQPSYQETINQQIQMEYRTVMDIIQGFYRNFQVPEINQPYKKRLDDECFTINQKLEKLKYDASQNEIMQQAIVDMKHQYENFVTNLRNRIQELEVRQHQEEQRQEEERRAYYQRLEQINKQKLEIEERARMIEEQKVLQEQKLAQISQRPARLEVEPLPVPQPLPVPELPVEQVPVYQVPVQQPSLVSQTNVHVSGSYEHTATHTGVTSNGNSGSSRIRAPVAQQPHIDMIDVQAKIEQDLNKLESEVRNFQMYNARLTESNSANILVEAQQQSENLKNQIRHLCDTSNQYQNLNVYNDAVNLEHRLDQMFNQVKNAVAQFSAGVSSQFSGSGSYSAESEYGATAKYSSVQAPHITDIEYEHSKSIEAEITRVPSSSQRHASGSSYGSSSGYSSSSSYGTHGNQQQVECPEAYANQPCIQSGRHRRDVGDHNPQYPQQHQPILDDYSKFVRNRENIPNENQDYAQQHVRPQYNSHRENLRAPESEHDDLQQHTGPIDMTSEYQPTYRQNIAQQTQRSLRRPVSFEDLTRVYGTIDDYYLRQNQRSHVNRPINSAGADWEQRNADLSQQHINYGKTEELESYEKPRNQASITHNARDQAEISKLKSLDSEWDIHKFDVQRNNDKSETSQILEQANFENSRIENVGHRSEFRREETTPITIINLNPDDEIKQEQQVITHEQLRTPDNTLEKSGFNDKLQKNFKSEPADNQNQSQNGKQESDNPTLQQSGFYDYPERTNEFQHNEKSVKNEEIIEESRAFPKKEKKTISEFTLENSGFGEVGQQNKKYGSVENLGSQVQRDEINNEQSYIPKPDDFTLEKSGFGDLSKQDKNLNQQQRLVNNFNEKLAEFEQFNKADSMQQTAGQIDFGPESQIGRQLSSQVNSKEREYGQQQHPTGQYMVNLHQDNYPTSNIQKKINQFSHPINENIDASIIVLNATPKPAPKPVPINTRAWQVSSINNVPKQSQFNEQQQNNFRNIVNVDQSIDNEKPKQSEPLRGDLPGYSEPSTAPAPIMEAPITPSPIVEVPINKEEPKPSIDCTTVKTNEEIYDIQTPTNQWTYNNNEQNQYGYYRQSYKYNQKFHHNYGFTQQANYNNQNNYGNQFSQQIQQPSYQQSGYNSLFNQNLRFNSELKPLEFNQGLQSKYKYQENFAGKFQMQNDQESTDYTLQPEFEHQSSQLSQQVVSSVVEETSQNPDDFVDTVMPLEEVHKTDDPSTTPHTFWKRVGHQLSQSFDKAKDKAKTYFG